jgi:hypothetical protein
MWPGFTSMPIPFMDQQYDAFNNRANFAYQFCFWPRKCYITGQWLICTRAVRGQAIWTGPGEPVLEHRWYHKNNGLLLLLKGKC